MQKARRQTLRKRHSPPTACRHTVSGTFNYPSGLLFTIQSPYWFTIGRHVVLSLTGWSPQIRAEFPVLCVTWVFTKDIHTFSHTGLSPSSVGLSRPFR